jgi:polysaccharide pyruvyl transferase WcaK-like protein
LKEAKRKPAKRISFFGLFGQYNLGNECTLQAVIYNVRKYFPDAELNCICSGPEDAGARHNIPAFPMRGMPKEVWREQNNPLMRFLLKALIRMPTELMGWVKAFKILKGTHMLIVPGTGFLTDAYTTSFGWPYEIFKWSLMAKLCRCKLLYVSVGAGPIYRRLSRWLIKSALSLADFRSYRDESTKEFLKGVGFPAHNDRVYPDLAFDLPEATIPRDDNHKGHRPVVGIGLMSYAGRLSVEKPSDAIYRAYLEALAVFVRWLLACGYGVRLLIGDVLYDKAVTQDFINLLKEPAPTNNKGQIINEPICSVEDLLSQLAATDIVVATRFHNVLLALMLNKPVISISFHHKCASLMSEMGLSEYCQNIDNLDSARLIGQFMELEQNSVSLKSHIKQKIEQHCKALGEQYSFIFKDLQCE